MKMEQQTKRMKMENEEVAPTNETKFLDLNDDCINAILQWLPIEDLNSMSFTCKRIYQFSDGVYRRQHFRNVWAIVEDRGEFELRGCVSFGPDEQLCLGTQSSIPKRFISEIPNLHVWTRSLTLEVFEFIKANCCRNLKRLRFDHQNHSYNCPREYGELIKDQLSTVEWLKIESSYGENFHDNFLQFFGNLKYLYLGFNDFGRKTDWLNQVYPKLTFLNLGYSFLSSQALKNFIDRNVQLKTIECDVRHIIAMLPTIPKIKRLKILYVYDSQISDLKRCCRTGSIEWLDLNVDMISSEKFGELVDVKSLRVIRGYIGEKEPARLSAIQRMTGLHELEIYFGKSECQIASMLPNLTKVRSWDAFDMNPWNTETINDLLMPFAKNSKKLKELYPRRCVNGLTFQNFMEMDSARSMLGDAEKLKIYFRAKHGSIPVSLLIGNLASLKFIQIKFY